ncbi:tRNA lysidine(34) synthetase TilS [Simiduia curdlanivorans]|uniref:tRNA(Ile)-lysidine synthase n=1 Tax=Simiduia curdlanivorans TaxID=1492769 RepID=A0ABV8UZB5_9GAMM|nr:tRNA lysidine(34) synthetase TilS [Simiduia curdlanivorans]MDN3639207.1 tRNA lysidine(34) synthetase TilS [Simiduia curdlanivorans]
MSLSAATLFKYIPKQQPLWLALSGGLDSMVLLHLLSQSGLAFKALHVNHQLSAQAGQWQDHCQRACDQLAVELVVELVEVAPAGRGLEDAARQARFAAFAQSLTQDSVLLTAHHRDDQAETLLLRLLRGAGVHGLRAMLPVSPLVIDGCAKGQIVRPLLDCSRAELEAYARLQGLDWVTDHSNEDTSLDRNFLRHRVLPTIAQRWQGFSQRWRAAASHLAEAAELLDELAVQDLGCLPQAPELDKFGRSLSLAFIQGFSAPRAKNVLRYWLAGLNLTLTSAQLAELLEQLTHAKADAQVDFHLADSCLRRYQARVFCTPRLEPVPEGALELGPDQPIGFGVGRVAMRPAAYGLALPASGKWLVRTRRQGERSHPAGRSHSQTLKKLLQEVNLPPWLRDQVPLVCDGQRLLAVGDLWLEQGAGELIPNGYSLTWDIP